MLFCKDNENARVKGRNKQKIGEMETDGTTTQTSCKCTYRLMSNVWGKKPGGSRQRRERKGREGESAALSQVKEVT